MNLNKKTMVRLDFIKKKKTQSVLKPMNNRDKKRKNLYY